ncbi:U3 small nucleolar RNA-associated protein 18 homolog [Strongyloides ratti]|uniref:U3 small nucleolar RNA-associated protein 18 homolog n=1 Tax=Strongyloides ratti TaxID=34506 RepID=A0A090MSN2_STRRB|nr:U3 small nucleolar RNA-associated protein 18 homolog [Strongyloides ratti]CEF61283.1 U3 small nucleolar RNA-associated protein 18 homolog [Strongyloides ratti]
MDVEEDVKKTKKRMLTKDEEEYQVKLSKKLFLNQHFSSSDESEEEDNIPDKIDNKETKTSVWNDDDESFSEDDEKLKQKKKIRQNYIQNNINKYSWAKKKKLTKDHHSDSDDDELDKVSSLLSKKAGKYIKKQKGLGSKIINFNPIKDISLGYHTDKPVASVKFHPTKPVLMVASSKGQISLFTVCDPNNLKKIEKDNYLQHITIKKFRLVNAEYYAGGTKILASGYKSTCLYSYDILSGAVDETFVPKGVKRFSSGNFTVSSCGTLIAILGDTSEVYILNSNTFEVVATFIASSRVVSATFSKTNRNEIYGYTEDGNVYIWNLTSRSEQSSFIDKGCIHGSKIAISSNDQFLACGGNNGFINIYDVTRAKLSDTFSSIEPLYTISNLVTNSNILSFNNTSEILAYGSSSKNMQMRLYHVGTGTTYENFPHISEMRVKEKAACVDFSPNSGFVVFGTQTGKLKMYRLNNFTSY